MRKILAIVLSVAMMMTVFAGLSMTASAAGNPITFTAQSVTANAGDEITVDISVSENHYMVNGQIWIEYDPACLQILEVWDDEDNPYFEDINTKIFKSSYMWAFDVPQAGLAKMAFATSSSKGTTVGGVMFTLTFRVLEDAVTSEINVYVGDNDMNANDGVTNNGEDYAVDVSSVVGVISVESDGPVEVKGDINASGAVELEDAMKVFYFVNGADILTEDEAARADVNSDGAVNLADAVYVFYVVNGLI